MGGGRGGCSQCQIAKPTNQVLVVKVGSNQVRNESGIESAPVVLSLLINKEQNLRFELFELDNGGP